MEKLEIGKKSNDNFVFFGKLLIIAIYSSTTIKKLGHVDLPFLDIFQNNIDSNIYFFVWQILFLSSSILIFLNIKPKGFLFINGLLLIVSLLMNEFTYSNNIFFCGCMLISLSISNKSFSFIPIQLSILYFGAFIDKLLFEQWRNGDFMIAYFQNDNLFTLLNRHIETHSLLYTLTYSSIIIECLLAILVLIPKARTIFIILGLSFHFSTTIFMNSFFGMFIVAILISYYALVKTTMDLNDKLNLSRLFNDLKSIYNTYKSKKILYDFEFNNQTYKNYKAVFLSILLNPFTTILVTIFLSCNYLIFKQIMFLLIILFIVYFVFIDKIKLQNKKRLQNG